MDRVEEIEELKSILKEHARQISTLYDLFSQTKVHNDHRAFVLQQSLELMDSKLQGLSKQATQTFKSFDNLERAIRAFGFNDILQQYKKIHNQVKELQHAHMETNKQIANQTKYIKDLENVLRRTYILCDNNTSLSNMVEDNQELISKIMADASVVPCPDTPQFNPFTIHGSVSPLDLTRNEDNVE
jgi:DNA repair exonuclease SbcCD ATPase subunit